MTEPKHIPVMLAEVLEYVKPAPGKIIVDCTLGFGGHSEAILKKILPDGKLIGIEQDEEALQQASKRLEVYKSQIQLVHENFRNLDTILMKQNINRVDAVLMDLGVSSLHLDSAERGFSLKREGRLDMRMDKRTAVSAEDLVNTLSESKLAEIIKKFGEDRFYKRIASAIVKERAKGPIETTAQLEDIIFHSLPFTRTRPKTHPATRTFQALRIVVNQELESLSEGLPKAVEMLSVGGRIVVISFHSLEDRIVKETFKKLSNDKKLRLITKKPLRPTNEEVQFNPRARSACMRVAERIPG